MPRTEPFWSPDSRQIAFVSNNQTDHYPIYLIDIDTNKIRNLYTNPKDLISLPGMSWSPDGHQIVYVLGSGANFYLHTIDLESGLISRIDPHTGFDAIDKTPAWSPDGRQVAYQSYRDDYLGVYLIDMATWETRLLYRMRAGKGHPTLVPTGHILRFTEKNIHVYIIDVETGKASIVWNSVGHEASLAWSPPWK